MLITDNMSSVYQWLEIGLLVQPVTAPVSRDHTHHGSPTRTSKPGELVASQVLSHTSRVLEARSPQFEAALDRILVPRVVGTPGHVQVQEVGGTRFRGPDGYRLTA